MNLHRATYRLARLVLLLLIPGGFSHAGHAADTGISTACPTELSQRQLVLSSLHELGARLALGRICLVQEAPLHEIKQQALNRYAGCLQSFQVKATEIQDALEAGRVIARDTYKSAKNKTTLCKEVRLATN